MASSASLVKKVQSEWAHETINHFVRNFANFNFFFTGKLIDKFVLKQHIAPQTLGHNTL